MSERSTERPSIITRGFDDEPSLLYALEMQPSGRHVNVSREYPPPSYIGWPVSDAFDYSESMLQALESAYDGNNRIELRQLYAELEVQPKTFIQKLTELSTTKPKERG